MNKLYSTILVTLLALTTLPNVWAWEIERPSTTFSLVNERTENATTNGEATVGLGVHITTYYENDEQYRDGLSLRISATANSRKGIAYGWCNRSYSWVDIDIPGLNPEILMSPEKPYSYVPIILAESVRFYGGPESGEYTSLYVSKNGVLWFDNRLNKTDPPLDPSPYYGEEVPNTDAPNAFIAPFWRELNPPLGGKVLYKDRIYITPPGGCPNRFCAVISWINVPDKSGNPQTFEVIIELDRAYHEYAQNWVWFQYKSITFDEEATVGIEDHGGWEGFSIDPEIPPAIQESKAIEIRQLYNSFLVSTLTIKLSSYDSSSDPWIDYTPKWIRGYNVELNHTLPDDTLKYALALGGGFTLLLDAYSIIAGSVVVGGAGFFVSGGLVLIEVADILAKKQAEAKLFKLEPHEAKAHADGDVVDASLDLLAYWGFLDWETNNQNHWLNVTAELSYVEITDNGNYIDTHAISTSVILNAVPDAGNAIDDPNVREIGPGIYKAFVGVNIPPPGFDDTDDYYKFNVDEGMVLHLTMKPPNNTDFDLYLYDPSGERVRSSKRGTSETEEISYPTTVGGNWFIRVNAVDGYGICTLTIDEPYPAPVLHVRTKTLQGQTIEDVDIRIDSTWYTSPKDEPVLLGSHTVTTETYFRRDYMYYFKRWYETGETTTTITVNVQSDTTKTALYEKQYDPPGGGCPYVYTWNGSAYVLDNNVLGMSEVSNGSDVEDFYRLEQPMTPSYTGNHFSVYSLMLGEFENEHSYIDKVRLYAVDHDPNVNVAVTPDGEILTYSDPNPPISAVDNYGIDWLSSLLEPEDTYYLGFPSDYLLLDFGNLDVSQAAKLVLRANLEWKKAFCIHVQVLNDTGDWTDATALRTRYHWSTLIVDLADYLPNPDRTLKIRLYFTGIHKIDYVGLDTTPQQDHTLQKAALIYAKHSENGCVTLKFLLNDQEYAELVPGEQITLKFILPNTTKTRTFIIQIEGHYYTINN